MKRILVANDLSPCSTNALARAIGLAARSGAAIRIVHATSEPEELSAQPSLHRRLVAEARIMAEEIAGRPIEISARVSPAGPAHAIVREAEAYGVDLVVIGAHGEPRFRDAAFGTTGSYVLRHSECPVLVVRNDASTPYAKALVAIDGEAEAPPIVAAALGVAPAAEVFAVHAFSPSWSQALGGRAEIDREETRQELELEKILGVALAGRAPVKVSAERHAIVETGEALEVIMRETAAIAPDLLVMGTRRQATFLGSHAVDAMFGCPHDLLIVPEREAVAPAAAVSA